MDQNDKEPDVVGCRQVEYAIFLSTIYNTLFPSLLDKALDFYVWFFTKKEPTRIFTVNDIEDVLSYLHENKPRDIGHLAEIVQRMPIPDGIVVREAIRLRLNHLDTRNGMMRITTSRAYPIVKDCLSGLADAMG